MFCSVCRSTCNRTGRLQINKAVHNPSKDRLTLWGETRLNTFLQNGRFRYAYLIILEQCMSCLFAEIWWKLVIILFYCCNYYVQMYWYGFTRHIPISYSVNLRLFNIARWVRLDGPGGGGDKLLSYNGRGLKIVGVVMIFFAFSDVEGRWFSWFFKGLFDRVMLVTIIIKKFQQNLTFQTIFFFIKKYIHWIKNSASCIFFLQNISFWGSG